MALIISSMRRRANRVEGLIQMRFFGLYLEKLRRGNRSVRRTDRRKPVLYQQALTSIDRRSLLQLEVARALRRAAACVFGAHRNERYLWFHYPIQLINRKDLVRKNADDDRVDEAVIVERPDCCEHKRTRKILI